MLGFERHALEIARDALAQRPPQRESKEEIQWRNQGQRDREELENPDLADRRAAASERRRWRRREQQDGQGGF
jgi:hypothetical protein